MTTGEVQTARPTILVIDDDRILTALFSRVLASSGKVVSANSPATGLSLARELVPDLILLDVQMPGQDGFDIIAELKTDVTVRHVPVIFITADTLPEIESHCLEAGAADYIAKPVNPRVLQARARTHLLIKAQADLLAEMAYRDGLTGAVSRWAFEETLESECGRASWRGRPISLLLLDVDHFGAYDATYGHLAGDDVLVAIAGALAGVAHRPGDVVARFGGDEFAILLPETTVAQASAVADAACGAVRALAIRHGAGGAGPVVTVSVGVVGASGAATAAALTKGAQAQLTHARSAGGDRISA